MPLTKGIKKLFRRRSKPQSALQANKGSSIRSDRPGPPGGKPSVSQGTEVSNSSQLQPSETDFSRESIPREESIVEKVVLEEPEEETAAEKAEKTPSAQAAMASSGERQAQFSHNRSTSGGTDSSLDEVSPLPTDRRLSQASNTTMGSDFNRDPPDVSASYSAIPVLEQTALPRGGINMDTQAVGRVQVCLLVCLFMFLDFADLIRYPFTSFWPFSLVFHRKLLKTV